MNNPNVKLSRRFSIVLGICLILQFIFPHFTWGDNTRKSTTIENRIISFAKQTGGNNYIIPVFFHTIERYLRHTGGVQSPLDIAFKAKLDKRICSNPRVRGAMEKLLSQYKKVNPGILKVALNPFFVDLPVNTPITSDMLKTHIRSFSYDPTSYNPNLTSIQSKSISPQIPGQSRVNFSQIPGQPRTVPPVNIPNIQNKILFP